MNVVALAGGVGGAKLCQGLARILPASDLTIIVNTADDFEHLGLRISPDLDTVCYTLAGLSNARTGWGRKNESWHALESASTLGAPTWFRLGDRDLGTHLERTRRLRAGEPLSRLVHDFCEAWGVTQSVLPMTDDWVSTIVETDRGDLAFQEYFVREAFQPVMKGLRFQGGDTARPAPGVLEALSRADRIVICPSNPWVSIGPILAIPGIRSSIEPLKAAAVSPIIGGRAVRGPAAKMYSEMGILPSALAVAKHYQDVIRRFVLDTQDAALADGVRRLGMDVLVADTLMEAPRDRLRLARCVLDFIGKDDL